MSPQNELAEQLKESVIEKGHTRNRSASSVTRNDKHISSLELPGNASGKRSRVPSFTQADDYSSGSEGTDDESSDDADGVTADLMPVTGFAVASSKRNADFHELFPDIPEGDYLIEGALHQRFINMGDDLKVVPSFLQIMAAHCNGTFSSRGDSTFPRTTCASTPISLGGSPT